MRDLRVVVVEFFLLKRDLCGAKAANGLSHEVGHDLVSLGEQVATIPEEGRVGRVGQLRGRIGHSVERGRGVYQLVELSLPGWELHLCHGADEVVAPRDHRYSQDFPTGSACGLRHGDHVAVHLRNDVANVESEVVCPGPQHQDVFHPGLVLRTQPAVELLAQVVAGLPAIAELDVGRGRELLIHHKGHGVGLAVEVGHALGEAIAKEHQIERGSCLRVELGHK